MPDKRVLDLYGQIAAGHIVEVGIHRYWRETINNEDRLTCSWLDIDSRSRIERRQWPSPDEFTRVLEIDMGRILDKQAEDHTRGLFGMPPYRVIWERD